MAPGRALGGRGRVDGRRADRGRLHRAADGLHTTRVSPVKTKLLYQTGLAHSPLPYKLPLSGGATGYTDNPKHAVKTCLRKVVLHTVLCVGAT